jgi:hypothetical protein
VSALLGTVYLIFQSFQPTSQLIAFPLDVHQTLSCMLRIFRLSLHHNTHRINKTRHFPENPIPVLLGVIMMPFARMWYGKSAYSRESKKFKEYFKPARLLEGQQQTP